MLLWSHTPRRPLDLGLSELLKLYQQTHEKHKYELCQWKYFFFSKQQLFIEILSWRPFEFGCANQPRSNWIETLWIFWPRYNCKNNILICPTLEFWMKDRRLFMMADLRDQASALVMNGLCWAQSISGGESENAIPQREMIHSVKPRFLECQPLQSSHINNKKIGRYEWTSEVLSSYTVPPVFYWSFLRKKQADTTSAKFATKWEIIFFEIESCHFQQFVSFEPRKLCKEQLTRLSNKVSCFREK